MAIHTTPAPERVQVSYLVSNDFCGKGGGPGVGELHRGDIYFTNRRAAMEGFPLVTFPFLTPLRILLPLATAMVYVLI